MLNRKHLPRPPVTRLHLIRHQQHAILIADLPELSQVSRRRRHVPALAEHRFDENSRRITRRRLPLQQQLELRHGIHAAVFITVLSARPLGNRAMLAVRKRHRKHTWHQRRVTLSVDGLGARHGHGSEGAAVVGSLHDDDVLLLGGMAGEFDGCFDGLGARVPEEERVEGFVGHQRNHGVDEVELGLLKGDIDLAMDQFPGLGLRGFCDCWMAIFFSYFSEKEKESID